jgi:N-acyl-D-aspartate/D-glutamate deacylase
LRLPASDRRRGPQLELPEVVRRLTSQPADLYGLTDRGRIKPGLRADLNVIDFGRLRLGLPVATADLPAGGVRILQNATGYVLTTVAGSVTRRGGPIPAPGRDGWCVADDSAITSTSSVLEVELGRMTRTADGWRVRRRVNRVLDGGPEGMAVLAGQQPPEPGGEDQ